MRYKYHIIDEKIREKGLSPSKFFKGCGISLKIYRQWKSGTIEPKKTQLSAITRKLGITVYDLTKETMIVGFTGKTKPPATEFDLNRTYEMLLSAGLHVSKRTKEKQKQESTTVNPPQEKGEETRVQQKQNKDANRTNPANAIRASYGILGPLQRLPILSVEERDCHFCKRAFEDLVPVEYLAFDAQNLPTVRHTYARGCRRCKTIAFDAGLLRQVKQSVGELQLHTLEVAKVKSPQEITENIFKAGDKNVNAYKRLPFESDQNLVHDISASENVVEIYANKCHCTACERKYQRNTIKNRTAKISTVSGDVISLNVMFCMGCGRYFLNYKVFKMYQKNYEGLLFEYKLSPELAKTHSSYFDFAQDSILSRCGYTVKDGTSKKYRQAVLRYILESGKAKKHEIIELISGFIDLRDQNPMYNGACKRWREDIAYVSDYSIESQQAVYGLSFRQGGK